VQLAHVFLQIKVPAKPFGTHRTRKRFLLVMSVHVKCQIVDLVERLVTDRALVLLFGAVGQFVVFVVTLLVKSFPTKLANVRLVSEVDPHVCVEGGAPVERLGALVTFVRFIRGVDDFVAT
jgi:hypothetical protein